MDADIAASLGSPAENIMFTVPAADVRLIQAIPQYGELIVFFEQRDRDVTLESEDSSSTAELDVELDVEVSHFQNILFTNH